jgi:chromosome transmission fidelity protein 4
MWHFKSYTDLSLHWSFDIKSTPLFLRTNETTLFVLDSSCNLIETPLDAPLTNYEKVYKDTNSAL